MSEALERASGYGSLRPLVPDDLREIQNEAFAEAENAGRWVTDVPVCLKCSEPHVVAFGGDKHKLKVQEFEIVPDECPNCEQTTIHVL